MPRIIALLTCLFISSLLFGQTSAPTYSNEFLSIGIGARAFGLGNAVVASQTEVESAFWNPSNLVDLSHKYDLSAMHAEYFGGLSAYDYIGFATKINPESAVGLA